jgi:hypothetical protein
MLQNKLENDCNFLAEPSRLAHANIARVIGHFFDEVPSELPDFDRMTNETKKTLFVMMPLYPFTLRDLIQYRLAQRRRSSTTSSSSAVAAATAAAASSSSSDATTTTPPTGARTIASAPLTPTAANVSAPGTPLLSPSSRVPHAHVGAAGSMNAATTAAVVTVNASPLFTEAEIIHLSSQLCNALVHLEKNSVVHRAVTPDNIFLQPPSDFKEVFNDPHHPTHDMSLPFDDDDLFGWYRYQR